MIAFQNELQKSLEIKFYHDENNVDNRSKMYFFRNSANAVKIFKFHALQLGQFNRVIITICVLFNGDY